MKRVIWVLCMAMLSCLGASAQQAAQQPLTMWYSYTVKPGMEAEFMTLVNTVGAPVRDKLMAQSVVQGWGVEVPLLRGPDSSTHYIWVAVNDYAAVGKVTEAMQAQLAKLAADEAKAAADPKKKPGMTTAERIRATVDESKTRDYLTRDLVFVGAEKLPPAGTTPWVRYNFNKVKPGMNNAYRAAWEKYNKPVLDKLVADGTLEAFGLSVEDIKTDGNWTHFAWYGCNDASGLDKVREAFAADRARRSPEEREAIGALFGSLTEAHAARSVVSRGIIFKLPGMK